MKVLCRGCNEKLSIVLILRASNTQETLHFIWILNTLSFYRFILPVSKIVSPKWISRERQSTFNICSHLAPSIIYDFNQISGITIPSNTLLIALVHSSRPSSEVVQYQTNVILLWSQAVLEMSQHLEAGAGTERPRSLTLDQPDS